MTASSLSNRVFYVLYCSSEEMRETVTNQIKVNLNYWVEEAEREVIYYRKKCNWNRRKMNLVSSRRPARSRRKLTWS